MIRWALTLLSAAAFAGSIGIGSNVSLGRNDGKTSVIKTGSLTTTAVTADQVVLTYTVTAGKTLYLSYVTMQARSTAISAVASILGAASAETPSGTKVFTATFVNPTTSITMPPAGPQFSEPVAIAAGTVVRVVTTPGATTSTLWVANLGGYER